MICGSWIKPLFVYSHSCSRGPLLPVLKTRARRLTGPHTEE